MSTGNQTMIEKLKGRENFSSWKFAMRALLELDDLWNVVEDVPTEEKKLDLTKDRKALSKIILFVETVNYPHIQSAKTAKEAWTTLEATFEDSGLTRRVGLLRRLVTAQLQNYQTVENYVNDIMVTAQKLNEIGLNIDSEWIGTLMLAGLPEEYKPMIMGLESSGIKISADSIKVKLLQDITVKKSTNENDVALYSQRKTMMRCYNCGKQGHIAKFCRMKKTADKSADNIKEDNDKHKSFFALFTNENTKENFGDWYLDSCSSSHITNNDKILMNRRDSKQIITAADNNQIVAKAIGDIKLSLNVDGCTDEINVTNTLYIPKVAANLLSVSKVVEKGYSVFFDGTGGSIIDDKGVTVAKAKETNGIYKMEIDKPGMIYCFEKKYEAIGNKANLWHRRLGHLNRKAMSILKNWSNGIDDFVRDDEQCKVCVKGKLARKPFKSSMTTTQTTLELIHTDICGPMEEISIGGARYIFLLVDDYSRKVFVYFIKNKNEISEIFKTFKRIVENETGNKIKVVRSDNGGEYTGHIFENILKESGIRHEKTVPYTPQQNGVAERLNRTIIEKARCMMFDCNLPKEYWAEASNTAVYLYNRSPTKSVKGKTPEEMWSNQIPDVSQLRIFGCKALVHVPAEKRQKWNSKAEDLLFMGYVEGIKGWKFINPVTKKITISRDAVFFENEETNMTKENNNNNNIYNDTLESKNVININEIMNINKENNDTLEIIKENGDSNSDNKNTIQIGSDNDSPYIEDKEKDSLEANEVRRSERVPKPKKFNDYVTYYSEDLMEPQCLDEALKGSNADKWRKAIEDEHESLLRNKTYIEVDVVPQNKKLLKTKWVLKIKQSENDIKYKARLVIKGCSQKYGIDYLETFSPVVKYSSLRYLFALASRKNLRIDQMDVTTAYLYGDIDEEIYVQPPSELSNPKKEPVFWLLKKSIYGLKQSGRCWNKKLNEVLKSCKLSQSLADPCVYYNKDSMNLLIVATYVDDFLIFYNDDSSVNYLKTNLNNIFLMKDLGEVKNCLGMRITRNIDEGKIWIDQHEYIHGILKKFKMDDCRPVSIPMEVGIKFNEDDECLANVPYQEAIGSLLYLSQISRPDISYSVHTLSRYNNNPKSSHWKAVKRIFRYIKGTINYKLEYCRDKEKDLKFYSDADWGNDCHDRHSITGCCTLLQGGAISWYSKKQRTVALSTTEAEYMALSFTAQEVLWLRQLVNEVEANVEEPMAIFCDNRGSIALTKNKLISTRSKHIDVRHHFVRELVDGGIVEIQYLPTTDQLADLFTKPLDKNKLQRFTHNLGLVT